MAAELADSDAMTALRGAMGAINGQLHDPEADKHLHVEFRVEAVPDQQASLQAGIPVFRDTDYIRIQRPGDKNDIIDRPVWMDALHRASDYHRFGRQYRAWKEGKAQEATGTPMSILANIGLLTKSDVASFNAYGIRTAEQFVSMGDADAQKFQGYSQMKAVVQSYLSKAKAAAPALELQRELKERDSKLAEQQVALAQQADALKSLADELRAMKQGQQKPKQ